MEPRFIPPPARSAPALSTHAHAEEAPRSHHLVSPGMPPATGSRAQRILVRLESARDLRALRNAAGGLPAVVWCSRARPIEASLLDGNVDGVILELCDETESELEVISRSIEQRANPVPVIVRFELADAAVELLLRAVTRLPDLRLSLRGFDLLQRAPSEVSSLAGRHQARRAIIARIARAIPGSAKRIVIGAAIVGERTTSVRELALLCGMSRRSVELQLQTASVAPAKKVLMCMLALHVAWDGRSLGWSAKRAAAQAEVPSTRALSARIERAIGVPLMEWVECYSSGQRVEHVINLLIRPTA